MAHKAKPIYVLGTGLSHDGSACLLKDGRIQVAIEKERLTRTKHDGFNDNAAIQYCLDAEGITLSDLTLIVQNANFGMFEFGSEWYRGSKRLIEDGMPVVTISHHLAHAYSAFGTSPFDEASIFVLDGCGSGLDECIDLAGATVPERPEGDLASLWFEKDSYYRARGTDLQPVFKDFSPVGMIWKSYPLYPFLTRHSIGGLYAGASNYVFRGLDDSGKLMGLAPYGRPGVFDFDAFDLQDGRVFVRYDWMPHFRQPARTDGDFKENFQHYADLAFWIQKQVEAAILYVVRSRYDLYPSPNLCYAGGVALNAVANARLLKEGSFERIYFQPAAGDNGLSIGCAYFGWLSVLEREKITHDGSTSFGRIYPSSDMEAALEKRADFVRVTRSSDYVADAASFLSDGKVVGWFQDKSEFGPRALGNRSILADPRLPRVREFINAKVKFREDFRPFAPSVLLEDAPIYFECTDDSPYMLLVAPVRPEQRNAIPAVVHRDHTARFQTVSKELNPKYHRLLSDFKQQTGLGVLLNTSFNRRGMPIVETPDDAVAFFLASSIDVLVMGDFVVEKISGPKADVISVAAFFRSTVRPLIERNLAEALRIGGVYEFNVASIQRWTVDLSAGRLLVGESVPDGRPDVLIDLTEADLRTMFEASSALQGLIQQRRLKIRGDQGRALQLLDIVHKRPSD